MRCTLARLADLVVVACVLGLVLRFVVESDERFAIGERVTWESETWFFDDACLLSERDRARLAALEPGAVFTRRGDYYEKDAWCWRIELEDGDEVNVFVDSQSVVRLP